MIATRHRRHSHPAKKNSGPHTTLMKPGMRDMLMSNDRKLKTSTHPRMSAGA